MEMKRLIIAALIVLLGTLFLSNITDTSASIDDTSDNEITTSQAEFDTSASSTLTITMYALFEEERNLVTD